MLEIYNEQVRDLLNSNHKKGGLKVRNHPKKGLLWYVIEQNASTIDGGKKTLFNN